MQTAQTSGAAQARAAELRAKEGVGTGLIIRVGSTTYDGIREWLNKVLDPDELVKRDPSYRAFFNHVKLRREQIRHANIRSKHTGTTGWMPSGAGRTACEIPSDVAGVLTAVCPDFFERPAMIEAFLRDHPEYDLQPDHFS